MVEIGNYKKMKGNKIVYSPITQQHFLFIYMYIL